MAAGYGLTGCHQAKRKKFTSEVSTSDPAAAKQLVGGFYKIEAKSWRWTAREFIVWLSPSQGSEERGAKLMLHFFIPEGQIAHLGPMTLSATVDDRRLEPETYAVGGSHDYVREVPAAWLDTNLVSVIFSFNKAAPPSSSDGRELGAIVSTISLITN